MEKICIAKLRKSMAYPGHPDQEFGLENPTEEKRRAGGYSFRPLNGSAQRRADAADRTVSLMLTQEQMSTLRSNRHLASSLSGARAEGFAEIQHRDETIVIKFEFDSIPPVRLLKIEEAIQMLRISKSTLKKMIRHGMLKSYKFGRLRRILLADILSYLEDHQAATVARPQPPESQPSNALFMQHSLMKEE